MEATNNNEEKKEQGAGSSTMNKEETLKFVESQWDSWFIPGLSEFIRIPNLSQLFDPEFLTNGLI